LSNIDINGYLIVISCFCCTMTINDNLMTRSINVRQHTGYSLNIETISTWSPIKCFDAVLRDDQPATIEVDFKKLG